MILALSIFLPNAWVNYNKRILHCHFRLYSFIWILFIPSYKAIELSQSRVLLSVLRVAQNKREPHNLKAEELMVGC